MGPAKCLRSLELTLAIIKPDVCRNPHGLESIRRIMLDNGFYFIDTRITQLSKPEAEKFYDEHKDKFFFNRLVTFMCSGLLSAHILGRENAIKHWRSLMGPTHVYKAQYEAPNSIRAKFGLTDTRNATHGSDSLDTARKEIGFFFPSFVIEDWYKTQEEIFRCNDAVLDTEKWIHRIQNARIQELLQEQ